MPHDTNSISREDLAYWRGMRAELLPEDRHDEAVRFLTSIFRGSENAPYLRRDLRHWKYYRPHPFMKEGRWTLNILNWLMSCRILGAESKNAC